MNVNAQRLIQGDYVNLAHNGGAYLHRSWQTRRSLFIIFVVFILFFSRFDSNGWGGGLKFVATGNFLAILCLRSQQIRMLQLRDDGKFLDMMTIGMCGNLFLCACMLKEKKCL